MITINFRKAYEKVYGEISDESYAETCDFFTVIAGLSNNEVVKFEKAIDEQIKQQINDTA